MYFRISNCVYMIHSNFKLMIGSYFVTWPSDISRKFIRFNRRHPIPSQMAPHMKILFGDDGYCRDRYLIGVAECTVEEFLDYNTPNGNFEESIRTMRIREIDRNFSNRRNGRRRMNANRAMAKLVRKYCNSRDDHYHAVVLCNLFNSDYIHHLMSYHRAFYHIGGIITVKPSYTFSPRKSKLPFEKQPKDYIYKEFVGILMKEL